MDEALYERVREFTKNQLWEPNGGLNPATRLAADIRIAGLDGKEFMDAYSREFEVDLPGFDWVDYFGPEGLGCIFLLPFARWLPIYDPKDSIRWGRDSEDFEITLRDLTDWAAAGSWTPPHTRSEQASDGKPDTAAS